MRCCKTELLDLAERIGTKLRMAALTVRAIWRTGKSLVREARAARAASFERNASTGRVVRIEAAREKRTRPA
jgi:hypothetical protein